MSYGGSNPPWQRNALGAAGQQNAIPTLQSQLINSNLVGYAQNQTIYGQNIGMGQQQNAVATMIPQLGTSLNSMNANLYTQAVQYPTNRGLNPAAFGPNTGSQHPQQQQQQYAGQQSVGGPIQQICGRVGVVTKFQKDYGFVDDEILFHKNVCKGVQPKMGDRVLVEASFSSTSAFKWNATMIQVLGSPMGNQMNTSGRNQQQANGGNNQRNGSGYKAVQPPNSYTGAGGADRLTHRSESSHGKAVSPSSRYSPDRNTSRRRNRSRELDEVGDRRKRKEREREREKDRKKDRSREKRDQSPERRERNRSPVRYLSPKRDKKDGKIRRYRVQMPKVSLNISRADLLELRSRYSNLYIPSDFFYTYIRWSESFPIESPFLLDRPCSFNIFHRNVEPIMVNDAILDPPDADSSFSARVMLMAIPPLAELHKKCFAAAEEKDRDLDDLVHPTRLINFLVGTVNKSESIPIGGKWSPSLDGKNPESDPGVLIKTAIRTCKALTGIDLSQCTHWYRFMELYYKTSEVVRKDQVIPSRTETVVIFLPDIRSCIPTQVEWDALSVSYMRKLESVLAKGQDAAGASSSSKTSSSNRKGTEGEPADGESTSKQKVDKENQPELTKDAVEPATGGEDGGTTEDLAAKDKDEGGSVELARKPDLDPKTMKITELRSELEARGLSSKGLKPQLVAKLLKAMKAEPDVSSAEEIEAETTEKDTEDQQALEHSNAMEHEHLDENLNSSDGIEIDMSDIIVLDEYDSKKDKKHKDTSKRTNESKHLDEHDIRLLERRYRLPETPQILVHPSSSVGKGDFTCSLMSLSILLDYRPVDKSKYCFELSLFAEQFNEMLMRDFGFNIYKAVHNLPADFDSEESKDTEKDKDGKRERKTKTDDEDPKEKKRKKEDDTIADLPVKDKEKANVKEEVENILSVKTPKSSDGEKERRPAKDKDREREKEHKDRDRDHKDRDVKDRERDRERDQRERRISRRDDESEGDDNSIRSGDPKRRDRERTTKKITVDSNLLLSFIYFDQTHCGYIYTNHIEDLFYSLGLNLARSDIKHLKVLPRLLFYRQLTDQPKDDKTEGAAKTVTKADIKVEFPFKKVTEIPTGNTSLLPVFRSCIAKQDIKQEPLDSKDDESGQSSETDTSLIMHKGCLLDVDKLLDQLNRSEKAREKTEELLVELRKNHTELKSSNTKAKDKIKDLQVELKNCGRLLNDAEQGLSASNKKAAEYSNILLSIHDKVAPIFTKSDRSSRSDSVREREKERDRKDHRDRDEHRDKEKEGSKNKENGKEKVKDSEKEKEISKEPEIAEDTLKEEEDIKTEIL